MENLDTEFLIRCRKITNAFEKKHGTWSISNQILHVYEEVSEVQNAVKTHDHENLLEECCDVILSAITIFDLLGTDHKRIQEVMESTLKKIELRSGAYADRL